MIGYIISSVFILLLLLFVYREYKNEKEYQDERRQKHQYKRKEDKKRPIGKPVDIGRKERSLKEKRPSSEPIDKAPLKKETEKVVIEKTPVIKEETPEVIEVPEVAEVPKVIPISLANYPQFDHSRLLKMGLSEAEAKEFVAELIPQIEAQIPLIKETISIRDFHGMERLTHSIKGSSTTVGTGGVSDLLVDFNTYLKTGRELAIAEAYVEQLKHYCEELKQQYS
jgi:HPt (histidine-containing phosphotransfer) domain-containing protein